ncbi:hypothetical protein niasHT_028501 [Heterodera trifolii]|uniref:Uncharacterized protein n=1 Tax=Heterodera trifolii TaxID=157864 RepID=A0ABD2KPT8_9BILA
MMKKIVSLFISNVEKQSGELSVFGTKAFTSDESVLIYDSRELLSMLKQNRWWSLDGTFRSVPKPWTQVFVIGCYVNNRMVVAAQALLPGKTSNYYAQVLQKLKRAIDPTAN